MARGEHLYSEENLKRLDHYLDYLSGRGPKDDEIAKVEAHLKGCADCRALVEARRARLAGEDPDRIVAQALLLAEEEETDLGRAMHPDAKPKPFPWKAGGRPGRK